MKEQDQGGFVYPQVRIDRIVSVNPHSGREEFIRNDEIPLDGITRRDWLAGLAMQGAIASLNPEIGISPNAIHLIPKDCYDLADAMIQEGKQ